MPSAASVMGDAILRGIPPEPVVFGGTGKMNDLRERIAKFAPTDIPVLIHGESGTGKEVLAQLIHLKSGRDAGQFAKMTCSTIQGSGPADELFEEKSGITGGTELKSGIMERAAHGTLFIDDIGDLTKDSQIKLLQVLQGPRFNSARDVEIRIVCATRRNLDDATTSGDFLPELLHRINTASIDLPPLRERTADIPLLVEHFLRRYQEKFNCSVGPISPATMQRLESFSWPGNIRELENVIRHYVILGSEGAIRDALVEPASGARGRQIDSRLSLKAITKRASQELEREIILKILADNGWNRSRTAKVLGISYRALLYKLKDAGIQGSRVRGQDKKP